MDYKQEQQYHNELLTYMQCFIYEIIIVMHVSYECYFK